MEEKKKIVAICGSTRANSTNLSFIYAIRLLSEKIFETTVFTGIASIPHFNPDVDTAEAPAAVIDFREQLKKADGILICTPEYAMGVPGTLKNVIDWTVSSMEFSHKPVALITASSAGSKGHASLIETLSVIEAKMNDETKLLVPFAKTKISNDHIITDNNTLAEVKRLIDAFNKLITETR